MSKRRWRRILEIEFREAKKKGHYFNRKTYKKIRQIWNCASRSGLIDVPLGIFERRFIVPLSRGYKIQELSLSISQLEKKIDRIAKKR